MTPVYAANFYPDLCRNIYLKEGVESFIFKGANLMWPGVADLESLPADLNADDVVAIRKSGDNLVVAIAALASEPGKVNKAKPEGQAAFILHMQGDSLWNVGNKEHMPPKWDRKTQEEKERAIAEKFLKKQAKQEEEEDDTDKFALLLNNKAQGSMPAFATGGKKKAVPKELKMDDKGPKVASKGEKKDAPAKGGKAPKEEEPAAKKGKKDTKKDTKKDDKKGKKDDKTKPAKKAKQQESGDEEESEGEEEQETEEMDEKATPVPTPVEDPVASDAEASESESEDEKEKGKGKGKKKAKGGAKKDAPKAEEAEGPVISKEQIKEMDQRILEAFLNAVKISLQGDDLPIEIGKFWSDHITKCRTVDSEELDLKISSHKKIGKFLQQMQKDKLLVYEEANKKNPVPRITKVEFHAKKIAEWTPTVSAKDLEKRLKDNEKEDTGAHSWRVSVEIVKVYKPTDLVSIFLEK